MDQNVSEYVPVLADPFSQHLLVVGEIWLANSTGECIPYGAGWFDFIKDPSMLIKWVADMRTYSETFLSVFRYFLRVIFEVTYVGLVHCGFVTWNINYYHLILEYVSSVFRHPCLGISPQPSWGACRNIWARWDSWMVSRTPVRLAVSTTCGEM